MDLPACNEVGEGDLCKSHDGECGTDRNLVNCPPFSSVYQKEGEADISAAAAPAGVAMPMASLTLSFAVLAA